MTRDHHRRHAANQPDWTEPLEVDQADAAEPWWFWPVAPFVVTLAALVSALFPCGWALC